MSVVLAVFPIGVGLAVGASVASLAGVGVVGQIAAAIIGALVAMAVYEYSPLPLVVGFMAGPQRRAGFWGFKEGGDSE